MSSTGKETNMGEPIGMITSWRYVAQSGGVLGEGLVDLEKYTPTDIMVKLGEAIIASTDENKDPESKPLTDFVVEMVGGEDRARFMRNRLTLWEKVTYILGHESNIIIVWSDNKIDYDLLCESGSHIVYGLQPVELDDRLLEHMVPWDDNCVDLLGQHYSKTDDYLNRRSDFVTTTKVGIVDNSKMTVHEAVETMERLTEYGMFTWDPS